MPLRFITTLDIGTARKDVSRKDPAFSHSDPRFCVTNQGCKGSKNAKTALLMGSCQPMHSPDATNFALARCKISAGRCLPEMNEGTHEQISYDLTSRRKPHRL